LGHRWAAARKWETPAQILSYQRRRRARACHRQKEAAQRSEKALLIPDGLRIEALDCRDRLKPYNASLKDAVSFFVSDHEARKKSCSVQAATGEYLKLQKLNHRSERHIGDLKYRLGVFNATFGPRLISELSVHEVEKWLHGLEQSPKSLNNFHTAVSALFSFAVKRSYASSNPLIAIDKIRIPAKAPGILSPVECEKLLNAAGSELLPSLAIQAFCGVRSAEALRLSWSDVDITRGFVQVAAEHAKGARRRLVEMSENLKEWLLAYTDRSGKLWPLSHMEFYRDLETARADAGISKWPSNALRHSYASYHPAFHQNAAALALQMGHTSQAMIPPNDSGIK
jgi:integrase